MKNIIFYGAEWCSDCRRAKSFLDSNQIDYNYIDMEKIEGAVHKIVELNNGKRIIPTILIDDTVFSNPDNQKLKEVLNIN